MQGRRWVPSIDPIPSKDRTHLIPFLNLLQLSQGRILIDVVGWTFGPTRSEGREPGLPERGFEAVDHETTGRGIDVSYETVRRWALKFGAIIARKLRRGRPRPDVRWHLDEVFVSINGRQLYVWRAVDSEGEILDILVHPRRDRKAALKLMRKLLKKHGVAPATIVTDKLGSYRSALRELGFSRRHDTGR